MGNVRELAERAWNGDTLGLLVHPAAAWAGLEELAGGLAFVCAFGNVTVVDGGDGLILIDTSSPFHASLVHGEVRRYRTTPVRTAVYTHGHVDHVSGISEFDGEARRAGGSPPEVVAHENVRRRFERYRLTRGWNARINHRQFGLPVPLFPDDFRAPDRTFADRLTLELGDLRIELHHDEGETDDHAWAWIPGLRTLCTGDFFIWASPNCGNPQKVQRFPREWAAALRKMEALGAERLLPGHGPPILGAERVRVALADTAALLESLVTQTLALMNEGARLDDVLHSVRVDPSLLDRPYLRPVYDDPEFIVRNLWRLYGGWYDGNPAHLKPAGEAALARELAALAGGAPVLARRAEEVAAAGDLRLASDLVELAHAAAPEDPAVRPARAAIYSARVAAEPSAMAKAIFGEAARASSGSGR